MEQASREAFTPETQREIFSELDLVIEKWRDLGGFESFVFANDDLGQVLRVTHHSHRSSADIEAELEFLTFLRNHGASVCAPLEIDESYTVTVGDFVCSLFEMAKGRLIAEADWGPDLFRQWGQAIGQFHKLSTQYEPTLTQRFDWREDANLHFRSRIPAVEAELLNLGDRYLAQLGALPRSKSDYGLIHSDAHAGNFFLTERGLQFFDFDDCCYQWFAFDVATILFSAVLQPWMADDQAEREAIARHFLPEFLAGYGTQFEVSPFLIDALPLFLKLREFSLYAVIHSHMDVNHLTDWYPIKFMNGRRDRLEADKPYLDIDFESLAKGV